MRALKGLLIYIGIIFAIIVGIAVVLFGIMYFVPTFRIMGVGVIHKNESFEGSPIVLSEYSGYDSIELNLSSKSLKINITPDSEISDIKFGINLKSIMGITFDITEFTFVKDVKIEGGVLKINISTTEPAGLISLTDSSAYVKLPASLLYKLTVNTEGGDVNIGNTKTKLNLSQINVTTNTGDLTVNKVTEGEEVLSLDNLNLITNSGNFNLDSISNINVVSQVKLRAEQGDFKFDTLNASLDVRGNDVKLTATNINSTEDGFSFITEKGFFDITNLSSPIGTENTIVTENCDIDIDNITGRTGIVTSYGDIDILKLNNSCVIDNTHGNVTIGECLEDINITTKMGNIKVSNYLRNGKFKSDRGNINVVNTSDYADKVSTYIENSEGEVVLDNKVNRVTIVTTGKSKVTCTIREIKTDLTVDTMFKNIFNINNQGSCEVLLPTTPVRAFKYYAVGNVRGQYSGYNIESGEDTKYCPSIDFKEDADKTCEFEFRGNVTVTGYAV